MLIKLFVCVLPSQIRVARVSIFDTRMSSLPLTRVENVFLNFAVLFLFSDTFSGAT